MSMGIGNPAAAYIRARRDIRMRKDAYERKSFILHREGESQADALQTAMAVMTIKNGEACFFVRGEALSQGRCY